MAFDLPRYTFARLDGGDVLPCQFDAASDPEADG